MNGATLTSVLGKAMFNYIHSAGQLSSKLKPNRTQRVGVICCALLCECTPFSMQDRSSQILAAGISIKIVCVAMHSFSTESMYDGNYLDENKAWM